MNIACGIMYDNSGKILMGLRKENGPNPNYWEFPGGKQENNETIEECLHREWNEELNLDIDIQKKVYTTEYNNIICHFFIGKIKNIGKLRVNVHQYIGFYKKKDIYKLRLFEGDSIVLDNI